MTVYHMKRTLYDRFFSRRTGEVHLDRISNDEDLGLFLTKEAAVRKITELSPNIELNYTKKKGLVDLSKVIKKTLIDEGYFELKKEDLEVP